MRADNPLHTAADELSQLIDDTRSRLLAIAPSKAAEKPYPDKWSIQEIIGHAIDSALNNHQRIVRLQQSDIGRWVYDQEHWVAAQRYQEEDWKELVQLWYSCNRHLAHVIRSIDPAALDRTCDMGYPKPATLRFVAEDYVRHLRHHLDQIFDTADARSRKRWAPKQ